jgi:hypothetical protein
MTPAVERCTAVPYSSVRISVWRLRQRRRAPRCCVALTPLSPAGRGRIDLGAFFLRRYAAAGERTPEAKPLWTRCRWPAMIGVLPVIVANILLSSRLVWGEYDRIEGHHAAVFSMFCSNNCPMKPSSTTKLALGVRRAMCRIIIWGCWGLLALALTSCTTQTRFLREAANHDSQAVVAQHLGPPDEVWPLADGETLWRYRADQRLWAYWRDGWAGGSAGGLTVEGPGLTLLPGGRCTEYVLRFDREQILRAWTRQPCRGFAPDPASNP